VLSGYLEVLLWTKQAEIVSSGPAAILANTTRLPSALMPDYDRLWTEARVRKLIEGTVTRGVVIEVSARYKLPRMPFLKLAEKAGVKFIFGSNGRYPKMGLLDSSIQMAKQLGLKQTEMFNFPRKMCVLAETRGSQKMFKISQNFSC